MKLLIVNADDYGFCTGVNCAVIDAHLHGILTSTTMMATGAAVADALARLAEAPRLDVGCHLLLVDGRPAARPDRIRSLLDNSDRFPATLGAFLTNLLTRAKAVEVVTELRAQIELLLEMGIKLSHLDSHKHTHAHPMIADAVMRVAEEYKIGYIRSPFEDFPLRNTLSGMAGCSRLKLLKRYTLARAMSFYRRFFNQKLNSYRCCCPEHFHGFVATGYLCPENIASVLEQTRPGVNELMCHPGLLDDELRGLDTRLKESREIELAAIKSTEARTTITRLGIELTSFSALQKR